MTQQSSILPHNFLPITRPLEETNLPSDTFFYDNVVINLKGGLYGICGLILKTSFIQNTSKM